MADIGHAIADGDGGEGGAVGEGPVADGCDGQALDAAWYGHRSASAGIACYDYGCAVRSVGVGKQDRRRTAAERLAPAGFARQVVDRGGGVGEGVGADGRGVAGEKDQGEEVAVAEDGGADGGDAVADGDGGEGGAAVEGGGADGGDAVGDGDGG